MDIDGQNFTKGSPAQCSPGGTYTYTVSNNIIADNTLWGIDVYNNGCAGLVVTNTNNTINSNAAAMFRFSPIPHSAIHRLPEVSCISTKIGAGSSLGPARAMAGPPREGR